MNISFFLLLNRTSSFHAIFSSDLVTIVTVGKDEWLHEIVFQQNLIRFSLPGELFDGNFRKILSFQRHLSARVIKHVNLTKH